MRKKLPIILLVIFSIVVVFRIFVIYVNFDSKVLNEKKYENLIGGLEHHLKPYEENSIKFRYARFLNKYDSIMKNLEDTAKQNVDKEIDNKETDVDIDIFKVSADFTSQAIKLNKKLNDLTDKYILPEYNQDTDSMKEDQDKKDDMTYVKSINKNKIVFNDEKMDIQSKTLEKIKPILKDQDYSNLIQAIDYMNSENLYDDSNQASIIYSILINYDEIPAEITTNQLRGLYKVLAYYEVKQGKIVKEDFPIIVEEKENYEEYINLINLETIALDTIYNSYFKGFFIFTDGEGNMLSCSTDYQKSRRGYLGIDYEDFKDGLENDFGRKRFYYSMVNQISNVVVKEKNQIDYSKTVPFNLEKYGTITHTARKDAYIYQFYSRFWNDQIYLDSIATEYNTQINARKYFYLRHQDDFLNEYASQDPFKDIVESMTRFILFEKNTENNIKGEKIRFFYEYDDIIELKDIIGKNLLTLENN